MKKMALITFLIAIFSICHAPELKIGYIERTEAIQPFERIWKAVCMVESTNDPLAYNKREEAVGVVQIRQVRLNDFNKRTGNAFRLSEMYNEAKSKVVFMYYARQHHYNEIENIAREWNGSGRQTLKYWLLVKKYL